MDPIELDRARIERFLARAVDTLEGEWLLVGGAAAAVWFAPDRTTEDIDLVGWRGTNAERLRLLELAASEGLPVESVNSAADYFVRRVPGWETEVVVLRRGTSTVVYRPSATMFLLFKIGRLGEQDLDDCLALLDWCRARAEPIDAGRVRAAIAALPPPPSQDLARRRRVLDDALAVLG